ncbi:mechanosensitive ion channel family protein [Pulveribacter suum]|uniref:Small-conductance mechanosensitive channel n=1 Tax=Pulveribacter suum TaxID=2116657 RepID=A0A2P1NJN9_9BURK|nr:mechanosensitive ion channel family protein [Pulveribacter suum]AVP57257.1 mechanosensitive ion channel protein MscS [Pulveribacter suum]
MHSRLTSYLPLWMHDWLEVIVPLLQLALIALVALLLQRLLHRILRRASEHYQFPHDLLKPVRNVLRWLVYGGALLLALERLGVSASVLWTAFTGFATVGAVAFFAAWSVLSNLFCALLIVTVGPYRIGDHIELLDSGDKPGALGRVVDINMLYTTLEDATAPEPGTLLQIPNALIFQRVLRRWRAGTPVPAERLVPPVPPVTPEQATVLPQVQRGSSLL